MRGTGGGQRDRPASCIHRIYAAKVQGGAGFADKFIITGQKTRLYRGTRTVQITANPGPCPNSWAKMEMASNFMRARASSAEALNSCREGSVAMVIRASAVALF